MFWLNYHPSEATAGTITKMALMKVKGNLERLFDKNLNDLVRGIRNHKDDEAKYIATCLEEIKQELRQHNTAVKANAVQKLTYLQMQGYDISWAGFNVVEVEIISKKFDFAFTNLFFRLWPQPSLQRNEWVTWPHHRAFIKTLKSLC